jgi:nucleoside-diphosphate-sugar epimerase
MGLNISILGSTSHIAKGLIDNILTKTDCTLTLFARNTQSVRTFMHGYSPFNGRFTIKDFAEFTDCSSDVIINCVGYGDPKKIKELALQNFLVTEKFDNMVISYLEKKPDTLYVFFSSGAVYGTSFSEPVIRDSKSEIEINNISSTDYYRIAKLNSEAKHRSINRNIVDIRVFNYFSRFIDIDSAYLIAEIIRSVNSNREFKTNEIDIVRDYAHPVDIFDLIMICIEKRSINDVFDVYSLSPITKFAIIDFFEREYKLKTVITKGDEQISATGRKHIYYSKNKKAEIIGYKPRFSSLDTIKLESEYLLRHRDN